VSVRATDDAGNTAVSSNLAFTVDSTPPRILSFTPVGTVTATTSQLVVQFSDDALNQTTSGNAAFAGSVRNLNNFRLISTTSGQFDLSNSEFQYDTSSDRLVINLRNASGNPFLLSNGTWQFTINGTSSLQDVAGNRIDGDNNGTEGGDFVRSFTISVPPAGVSDIHLAGTKRAVSKITVSFSQALDRTGAQSSGAYQVLDAGRDGIFDTPDDVSIDLGLPRCNPSGACTSVTLDALQGQSLNRFFLLKIDRSIVTDAGGNPLDLASTRHLIGRGSNFAYTDSNGDQVTVSLDSSKGKPGKGGLMDVIRYGNGEGRSIHIERNVNKQSAQPGRSALRGTVTPTGDGVTHFDRITGADRINLSGFPQPPFIVGQISAMVVDRALDGDSSAGDMLADSVVSVLSGGKKRKS
jgi:hypothetical protein